VSCPPAKSPAHIIEFIIPLFKVFVLLSASYNLLHRRLSITSKFTFNKSSLETEPELKYINVSHLLKQII